MPPPGPPVPVVVFAYARPACLARVLTCLRENHVPLIHAYADGPKGRGDEDAVRATRALLKRIDWADVTIVERDRNLGLGRNVIEGVTEIASQHEAFIVWEDDLVAVPGTYAWLVAALRAYASDERVMSVTAWTHPRVRPAGVRELPYFDFRAECWVWGSWAGRWRGMREETAQQKLATVERRGVDPECCGSDLPRMAEAEGRRNLWAVRWLYHHLQHDGLCLRPPWSMVRHIGTDGPTTNASGPDIWADELGAAVPIPSSWPVPRGVDDCRELWRAVYPPEPLWKRIARRLRRGFPSRR